MPTPPGHIYPVDDTADVRHYLGDLLRQLGYTVASYPDAESFLQQSMDLSPAVLLLDMRMPGMSGVQLQQRMKTLGRHTPIIFISGESRSQEIIDAMKNGAADFLCKPFGRQDLVSAIDKALALDVARQQQFARLVTVRRRFETLTEREREVFLMILQAHTNKEIGELTGVQAGTVKKHRASILDKMQAESVSELVRECRDLVPALTSQA